jgi:hypothetical protein
VTEMRGSDYSVNPRGKPDAAGVAPAALRREPAAAEVPAAVLPEERAAVPP